ncbi:hypothetical protein Acr_03g0007930 [Actinidia rufa]|uniref:Uncharacterized protein n=1 Tax=Actinidia rufa TaxID=165716 RepID=A0A7J0EDR6_9ERIC|nr:hypothetical protein Acr_03g0007930 [Actinidia rufa]
MWMSIFSSFNAVCAESFGQKVVFSWGPAKQGTSVDDSAVVVRSPEIREGVKKCKIGNSTEPPADITKPQRVHRRPRFAPELDGVHCFETIIPY